VRAAVVGPDRRYEVVAVRTRLRAPVSCCSASRLRQMRARLVAPGGTAAPLGFRWYRFPMEAVIDQAGRIVLPKPIRDALGLLPGTKVDISPYGAGAQVVPAGRTARLVEEDGVLVSAGDTPVDDDVVFALIDAGRK
jgi:AbrB family looped-hinge helix DNA binding protein